MNDEYADDIYLAENSHENILKHIHRWATVNYLRPGQAKTVEICPLLQQHPFCGNYIGCRFNDVYRVSFDCTDVRNTLHDTTLCLQKTHQIWHDVVSTSMV